MVAIQPAGPSVGVCEQRVDAHVDRVVIMAAAGRRCRDLTAHRGVCFWCRFLAGMVARLRRMMMPDAGIFVMAAVPTDVDMRTALMLMGRHVADGFMEMRNRGGLKQQVGDKTQECHQPSGCHLLKTILGGPPPPRGENCSSGSFDPPPAGQPSLEAVDR